MEEKINEYLNGYLEKFGYNKEKYEIELKKSEVLWAQLQIDENYKTIHK